MSSDWDPNRAYASDQTFVGPTAQLSESLKLQYWVLVLLGAIIGGVLGVVLSMSLIPFKPQTFDSQPQCKPCVEDSECHVNTKLMHTVFLSGLGSVIGALTFLIIMLLYRMVFAHTAYRRASAVFKSM